MENENPNSGSRGEDGRRSGSKGSLGSRIDRTSYTELWDPREERVKGSP